MAALLLFLPYSFWVLFPPQNWQNSLWYFAFQLSISFNLNWFFSLSVCRVINIHERWACKIPNFKEKTKKTHLWLFQSDTPLELRGGCTVWHTETKQLAKLSHKYYLWKTAYCTDSLLYRTCSLLPSYMKGESVEKWTINTHFHVSICFRHSEHIHTYCGPIAGDELLLEWAWGCQHASQNVHFLPELGISVFTRCCLTTRFHKWRPSVFLFGASFLKRGPFLHARASGSHADWLFTVERKLKQSKMLKSLAMEVLFCEMRCAARMGGKRGRMRSLRPLFLPAGPGWGCPGLDSSVLTRLPDDFFLQIFSGI